MSPSAINRKKKMNVIDVQTGYALHLYIIESKNLAWIHRPSNGFSTFTIDLYATLCIG